MRKNTGKRLGAAALAALMILGAWPPALAAEEQSVCDEAYYATLDYYGGLTEGSVVKSYRLRGAGTVTDYGVYDSVENLTDSAVPAVSDGKVVFTPESGEDSFYFEGKTRQPYDDLPWTISVSYTLNGVPMKAEDLAGEKGLVEIALDVVPNPNAPEYARTNLVLTAATAFNADDILSLEAQGAEVQLVGNLRAVMYMVLPGEEQHFTIKVGTDSFEFAGLMFLAVPATLQQLDQVKDLKDAKEEAEDSLDAIDESLDVILDTLEGMSGSLNATASGLDRLNAARNTVSNGKGGVYDSTDAALAGLDQLTESLTSLNASIAALDRYGDVASQAVTETTSALNDLNETAQALGPELEATRQTITAIQADAQDMKKLLSDVEGYNDRAAKIAKSLTDLTGDMDDETEDLQLRLYLLESALERTKGISKLSRLKPISVGGMTDAAEIKKQWTMVKAAHQSYETALNANLLPEGTTFEQSIILSAYQEYCTAVVTKVIQDAASGGITLTPDQAKAQAAQAGLLPATPEDFVQNTEVGKEAAAKAKQASEFWTTVDDMGGETAMEKQLEQMAQVNELIPSINQYVLPGVNEKIAEVNSLVTGLTKPTAELCDSLADLLETMGDSGISGDLSNLAGLCKDLLGTMKTHEGEGAALIDDINKAGDILERITHTADDLLGNLNALDAILNTYEPEILAAITDVTALSASLRESVTQASGSLTSMKDALSAAEELLRASGVDLDEGTRQSLNGLSAALRRSTVGLDKTGTIRNAKTAINDLVDDKWDEHSGQVDGLLNIDAGAVPVSMTDSRNAAPESIQYVMRTQEIKVEEAEEEALQQQEVTETTFWGRVADMFVGIWKAITSFFTGEKG